jgi:sugar phosphate isomerase/epimerase
MKVLFFCPYWGSEHLKLEEFFLKVKDSGYDGVEMNIPDDEGFCNQLKRLLQEYSLQLIAQQYLPPTKEPFSAYELKMTGYLYHLASFNPLFINSHTGKDYYDFETNCRIIERANEISRETGVKIIHETHRGRFAFSAVHCKPYFDRYPDLRITADFSHWCCVSESYLDDQEPAMNEAIARAEHIHARIGYPQGPQVSDPAAPEWSEALDHHLKWWDRIISLNKEKGTEWFPLAPEFGPAPYMHTLPFTNQPVSSQWQNNLFMKELLNKRYSSEFSLKDLE